MWILEQQWFTVFEQHRRTNCVVSDLVMGNEYVFQVLAINQVGLSPEPCNSKDSAYIEKAGGHCCTWTNAINHRFMLSSS